MEVNHPDLLSLVLTLRLKMPAEDLSSATGPARNSWGRAAHALLLRSIQRGNPEMAAKLHTNDTLRPFTCSNLLGKFKEGKPDPQITYRIRYTAFETEFAGQLVAAVQPGAPLGPGSQVELDYLPFEITDVLTTSAQSLWSGVDTYQALSAAGLLSNSHAPRRVSLQFTSPTGFKSNGRTMPVPLPDLVFGHLLKKWNQFAPVGLPEEVKRYAEECLAISRFDIRSRLASTKDKGLRCGAVGNVTYAAVHFDRYWMSLIHILARFALYAGVGIGTATGMGQCRLRLSKLSEKK